MPTPMPAPKRSKGKRVVGIVVLVLVVALAVDIAVHVSSGSGSPKGGSAGGLTSDYMQSHLGKVCSGHAMSKVPAYVRGRPGQLAVVQVPQRPLGSVSSLDTPVLSENLYDQITKVRLVLCVDPVAAVATKQCSFIPQPLPGQSVDTAPFTETWNTQEQFRMRIIDAHSGTVLHTAEWVETSDCPPQVLSQGGSVSSDQLYPEIENFATYLLLASAWHKGH
jgi:hypothetical protein